jgi:hypothetical protein
MTLQEVLDSTTSATGANNCTAITARVRVVERAQIQETHGSSSRSKRCEAEPTLHGGPIGLSGMVALDRQRQAGHSLYNHQAMTKPKPTPKHTLDLIRTPILLHYGVRVSLHLTKVASHPQLPELCNTNMIHVPLFMLPTSYRVLLSPDGITESAPTLSMNLISFGGSEYLGTGVDAITWKR